MCIVVQQKLCLLHPGVAALLIGHRTCDSSSSSPALALLCSGFEQATYAYVPLSPSSIIWYRKKLGSKARLKLSPYSGTEMCVLLYYGIIKTTA